MSRRRSERARTSQFEQMDVLGQHAHHAAKENDRNAVPFSQPPIVTPPPGGVSANFSQEVGGHVLETQLVYFPSLTTSRLSTLPTSCGRVPPSIFSSGNNRLPLGIMEGEKEVET
jgi:hypothetical protein